MTGTARARHDRTPQARRSGLPVYGGNRRVAGLRREETAMLAGVSVDYYTRLACGTPSSASWTWSSRRRSWPTTKA